LLAGFTGLFGKLISLNEGLLVWYRMLFAAVVFYCILLIGNKLEKIPWREKLKICGVGVLLALHWVSFFGSIKLANISIGVVCFSTTSFFTALWEPLIIRRRFAVRELFFS